MNDNRPDEIYDKTQGNPVTKFHGNSTGNPVATMTQPMKCTLSFVLRHLRMANSDFLILVNKYRHTHTKGPVNEVVHWGAIVRVALKSVKEYGCT